MMCLAVVFCVGLLPVVIGRAIDGEELSVRSPLGSPAAVTAETALQFLLRNDEDMCLLKLVCGAGANVSRYGVYADTIAHSFGYKYQPFNFSVVRRPSLSEVIVGRNAGNDELTSQLDEAVFIRAPKFDYKQDFTWMVKITPVKSTKPVYVNKPVRVWKPVKWIPQLVKPLPVGKPATPLCHEVQSATAKHTIPCKSVKVAVVKDVQVVKDVHAPKKLTASVIQDIQLEPVKHAIPSKSVKVAVGMDVHVPKKLSLSVSEEVELATGKHTIPTKSVKVAVVKDVQAPKKLSLSVSEEVELATGKHTIPTKSVKVAVVKDVQAPKKLSLSVSEEVELATGKHTIPSKSVKVAVVKEVHGKEVQEPVSVTRKRLTASLNKATRSGEFELNQRSEDDHLRAQDVVTMEGTTEESPTENATVAQVEGEDGRDFTTENVQDGDVSNTKEMKDFSTISIEEEAETEDVIPEERSGFPATYVFNRAFTLGLRSGSEACTETFGECPLNVDRIVRFGSNLFASPLSTSDQN